MNRIEFMKELEWLLADISEGEREEALQYYEDYLNDAGVENEEAVIESLGSPEKLAFTIKAGLNGNQEGEFTENGYHGFEEEKNIVAEWQDYSHSDNQANNNSTTLPATKKKMSTGLLVLIIILCILFGPAIIGVGAGVISAVFGVLVGVLATIFALFVAVVALAFALTVCGIFMFGVGIVEIFTEPLGGCLLMGLGLLSFGVGLIFVACTVWLFGKGVPAVIRCIVNIFNKIFRGRKGANA